MRKSGEWIIDKLGNPRIGLPARTEVFRWRYLFLLQRDNEALPPFMWDKCLKLFSCSRPVRPLRPDPKQAPPLLPLARQGYVSAALVLGGVDVTGPHLYNIYPHGSSDKLPYLTMGSGSLAAMSVSGLWMEREREGRGETWLIVEGSGTGYGALVLPLWHGGLRCEIFSFSRQNAHASFSDITCCTWNTFVVSAFHVSCFLQQAKNHW